MKGKILQVCAIDLSVDALLKPLIKASMEDGYVVHNACTDTGKFGLLKKEGLEMIPVNIERKINLQSNLKSIWKLYQIMKKEKYDIVHVHTPIAAILARIAARLAKVPNVIYTAHGFYFHDDMNKIQYNLFFYLEKIFGRYFTDWILLQSKEDFDLCIQKKFQNPKYVIHLSNGVDVENKFNPNLITEETRNKYKKNLGIQKDDIVVGFIGRLVKEKGIFELIEAMNRIHHENENVKLLLVGDILESERDQESYKKLKNLLKEPYIIHPGFRKDTPELISIMDVFTLPSYREGLPRSIIEAMAMAKPVVATNIRGCREEVQPEVNGLLVNKGDSNQLYKALKKIISNRDYMVNYGLKGREIALNNFNEELVIQKQLILFDNLIEKK